MSFFDEGYEVPKKSNGFMKFEKGVNTFRILSRPIVGWQYWIEDKDGKRKPVRVQINEEHPSEAKHFWAMIVWNYKTEDVQILEITQAGVQRAIKSFVDNPKWGAPFEYDLSVTREGDDLKTKYSVIPEPKEELKKEIKKAYEESTINLNALYDGGNPFDLSDKELENIAKEI